MDCNTLIIFNDRGVNMGGGEGEQGNVKGEESSGTYHPIGPCILCIWLAQSNLKKK
jgi:hypothetical protein